MQYTQVIGSLSIQRKGSEDVVCYLLRCRHMLVTSLPLGGMFIRPSNGWCEACQGTEYIGSWKEEPSSLCRWLPYTPVKTLQVYAFLLERAYKTRYTWPRKGILS